MLAWWPGEGNANDIMGLTFENGTTMNGATYAPGKVGQAFLFDGVDSYVRADNTTNIDGGSQATYDAWVYPTAVPEVGWYFGILGAGDSTFDSWLPQQCRLLYWRTASSPAGSARFYIDCGLDNNQNYYSRMSGNDYPMNTWHFVAGTFNNGALNIYVNGILDNGDTAGTGGTVINTASNNYVWMGAHVRNDGSLTHVPFAGLIDEAEIFDRALSQSEIQGIFDAGGAGKCKTGCAQPPTEMIGWWQGNGNANDIIGLNHGSLENGATFGNGMVGQGFVLDGTNDYVRVPAATGLDVGLSNGFSVDAWIKPTNINNPGPLVEWSGDPGDPNGSGVHFYSTTTNAGNLFANIVDVSGVFHVIETGGGVVTSGTFQHVALTYDKTTGIAVLYHNGTVAANVNIGIFTPKTSNNVLIGGRVTNAYNDGPYYFNGAIDEVEIFNRILTEQEIRSIYRAGSFGKCLNICTPPPPNMVSWYRAENDVR